MNSNEFLNKRIEELKRRVNRSFNILIQDAERFTALDYPIKYAAQEYLADLAEFESYLKIRSELQANND